MVIRHVSLLMLSCIWPSVGLPAMVVALSICQCTAIRKICQLGLSVRGYLMKPAQDRPQMRKKPLQKWFVHCNRYCKITTRISIFARFFYGCQGQRSHDVVQLFFTLSIDPSSHNYPPNTCYQDYKAILSFFKFWEKWSFFFIEINQIWCSHVSEGSAEFPSLTHQKSKCHWPKTSQIWWKTESFWFWKKVFFTQKILNLSPTNIFCIMKNIVLSGNDFRRELCFYFFNFCIFYAN